MSAKKRGLKVWIDLGLAMDAEFQLMKKAVNDTLHHYETVFETIQCKYEISVSQLKNEIERLQDEVGRKNKLVNELQNEINTLKDENKSFMSVSTIVSLTNENANLRKTLSVMERTISRRDENRRLSEMIVPAITVPVSTVPVEAPVPVSTVPVTTVSVEAPVPVSTVLVEAPVPVTTVPVEAPVAEEDLSENTDGINLYEKTIKGVLYYVDDDDNIYKNEDGEAGDIIGKYVVKDGKRKLQWN